jgi:ribosome maturation factor RimP
MQMVRQVPANVQAVVEPVVTSLGYELVGVEYLIQGRGGLLRVYIDAVEGIALHDCQQVSHQLSGVLDVEDVLHTQYQLEVSSPGLDRPLFTAEHFVRFAGFRAKLKLAVLTKGQRKLRGVLRGMQDDQVLMEIDGEEVALPLSAIDKANLIPDI